jgi:hypothetical protein
MPTITLLARAYNDFQLRQIDRNLSSTFEGLKVETKICGVTSRRWIQIAVSGEDENVVLHYLADRIGFCPEALENVKKFSNTNGYVAGSNENKGELYVDIGVFSPKIVDVTIPLRKLQAQLGDGRKISLKKFVEVFGFCEKLPLTIRILSVDKEKSRIEAELSQKQQEQYRSWTKTLLDRLLILDASHDEIRLALKNTGFSRDVIGIEPLGILEYAAVCKFGTDAAGLIPRIGRRLSHAVFSVFKPRRVLEFLEETQAPIDRLID